MPIKTEIFTAIRIALRAKFIQISLCAGFILILVTWLSAEFSGRQPATIALDIGLSFIRLFLPIICILLTQELLTKEFDRKYFLTSFSYPKSRQCFLLGRSIAINILQIGLLILLASLLFFCVKFISAGYAQSTPVSLGIPYLITFGFFAVELFTITAMATLLSIRASTPSFVLIGTIGFTLAARSFSAIVTLLQNEPTLMNNPSQYQSSLNVLGYLLPDFHALDVRAMALYNSMTFLPQNWGLDLAASLIYATGLIALAIWSLNKKQFA